MIANYMLIKDNKITGRFSGPVPSSPLPDGSTVQVFPDDHDRSGQDIREYDADLNLLPLAQRVASGLITVPKGGKVSGEMIVPMTEPERVKAGLDPRPKGQMLDVDAQGEPILRDATIPEQVANGEMTQATADIIQSLNMKNERTARLAACDWTQTADQSQTVKDLWAPYRQALKDVPAQPGFPWTIDWPATPDGVKA